MAQSKKLKDPNRTIGLPSLAESRMIRKRALVLGRVRFREAAPQFWLWTAVLFLAFGVVYWHYSERELARQKNDVMAKQRAIARELAPRLEPLRAQVEGWVQELAGDWNDVVVDETLDVEKLSKSDGIYLRLMLPDAKSAERIEEAARTSLHDGFTSCLFVRQEKRDATQGTKCFSPSQCADGELCNEWGVCSAPSQPFNLRLMYNAMRILSPAWTDELHEATSDYQVRVFERDLEKVTKTDVFIGLEMVTRARYFTVLLDEVPEQGVTPVPGGEDAGVLGRPELRIQGQDHRVRVGIWDLTKREVVLRAAFDAGADFVPMGRMKAASQRSLDAQQRQVNNCGIAADLRYLVAKREEARSRPEQNGDSSESAPSSSASSGTASSGTAAPSALVPKAQ